MPTPILMLLAAAQAAAAPASAPDYSQPGAWLCRPGRKDACTVDQDVTSIAADGTRTIQRFRPAASPTFDCFYVYPTVSLDKTPNSDMVEGPEERAVAASQAARFAGKCRVYAPLYRQVTLTALRAVMTGQPVTPDRAMALADVTAAWRSYLARDNKGRGVVLIGHSQGSGILKSLIPQEIEGKPVQRQIISAMLLGTNVAVPDGADVGGDFKSTPLCRSDTQYGCVVSYVTFRADAPPPANSRFGKAPAPGQHIACTNPAALAGGKGTSDAILGRDGAGLSSAPMTPWTSDGKAVDTPFVRVPGLITTQCVQNGEFSYLAVTVNADPADPRTDTIVGDVQVGGTILKDWGLHLLDMPIAMGNLVDLAGKQAVAWQKAGSGKR